METGGYATTGTGKLALLLGFIFLISLIIVPLLWQWRVPYALFLCVLICALVVHHIALGWHTAMTEGGLRHERYHHQTETPLSQGDPKHVAQHYYQGYQSQPYQEQRRG